MQKRALNIALSAALIATSLASPHLADAQASASKKMLATEQALLDSLSAMAVADSLPKIRKQETAAENAAPIAPGSERAQSGDPQATAVIDRVNGDPALIARSNVEAATLIRAVATNSETASNRQKDVLPRAAAQTIVAAAKTSKQVTTVAAPAAKAPQTRADQQQGLSALQTANADLRRELHTKNQMVESLQKELIELRSQLSIAEVEVNRLSFIMDAKTRASLGQYNIQAPKRNEGASYGREHSRVQQPVGVAAPVSDVRPPSAEAALQVATIAVAKADLRLGPGTNHSALMPLPRGSRLTVETRQGEWLRVFAPSGERAWIHASLVTFGDSEASSSGRSAVAVRGFDANAEEEAFRRLQRGAAQK
jgi:uncharacterized protein YgiM (DUF1202 family)